MGQYRQRQFLDDDEGCRGGMALQHLVTHLSIFGGYAGLGDVWFRRLTLGIAILYVGTK